MIKILKKKKKPGFCSQISAFFHMSTLDISIEDLRAKIHRLLGNFPTKAQMPMYLTFCLSGEYPDLGGNSSLLFHN